MSFVCSGSMPRLKFNASSSSYIPDVACDTPAGARVEAILASGNIDSMILFIYFMRWRWKEMW